AAGGLGAVTQQGRALEHFHRGHAHGGGEVVGGGVGVGGRRHHDAVFQQGDLGGALGGGAADADIGAQTKAILLADIDAGNRLQQLIDIGGLFDGDGLFVN